ncbi:MAG TPA: sugar ABC transporter ATP-binding protein [Anaerolineales bacterium]|nr:sugar ABC transporter ATP-binding protein [Anaerolineales bacterium]
MTEPQNILEIRGLTKFFPGVTALNQVNLDIRQGEVHVLVGENGAGKSCLVKVLCGIYQPDGGEMFYYGQPYAPAQTQDAIRAGIRVVYQELNLLSYLSVAENIYFERLPSKAGLVNFNKLYADAEKMLAEVGVDISPKTPVSMLGIAQMQLVEIAKALSAESKVLILDEPTATLTSKEIDRLFEIIQRLKRRGVTIIYISHRLQELFEIGDRITVLRNGIKVNTCATGDVRIPDIVKMMVGREMEAEYPYRDDTPLGPEIFRVENLVRKDEPHPVSFSVRAGEIVGVAGLVGSGRTETMRAIFGADRKVAGKIYLAGQELTIRQPKDAVQAGLGLLTEDRKGQGLILDMSCTVNISLAHLKQVSSLGLVQFPQEQAVATRFIDELEIKTPSPDKWVRFLSGGNQQKVVLAKWIFRDCQVLIFDEPTRGIDVGAKYEIYLLLWALAAQGKAIIVVSSDLPELMGISHRIIVFSNGRIAGETQRPDFDQEHILSLAYQEYLQAGADTPS